MVQGDQVCGVVTSMGVRFHAHTVVLTTGTFLGGVIHIGLAHHSGGRAGDPPSIALAHRLRELPLRVGRLKTGTPPRIDARSVDFSVMEVQPGDTPLPSMSFLGRAAPHPEQVNCYITKTNERTHEIIRSGFDRSPMYTGIIEGTGPRYCPSIEDKVNRFADKDSHQIFVEPEGLSTHELYPNGISTSLPFDIQLAAVRTIQGFENAHITRPGYAIEYDYFNPQDLRHSLETKVISGLFFAGQINGTTGYEEAAAQGLLAGINAALRVRGESAWCPRRDEAYLGVLVDDLITHGTTEPYRMFTSRAEYRLLLREDNADLRLTEAGHGLGVVGERRWQAFSAKRDAIRLEHERLRRTCIQPGSDAARQLEVRIGKALAREYSLADLLKRPELTHVDVMALDPASAVAPEVAEQVEIQLKYDGYISRQQEDIEKLRKYEGARLPEDFDYRGISGLSNEIVQKLTSARPETLAQAARIPGVTPAAISLLLIYLKKRSVAGPSRQASA
jgi:tRNA uridine 5-carboxymethylaminomethyl modification enzyme